MPSIATRMIAKQHAWYRTIVFMMSYLRLKDPILDVQIPHLERMTLDKCAARLDRVTHQDVENLICLHRILDRDLQKGALLGDRGRCPELIGIHFSQSFVALDREALLAKIDDVVHKFSRVVE